jgi:hypothetical protein
MATVPTPLCEIENTDVSSIQAPYMAVLASVEGCTRLDKIKTLDTQVKVKLPLLIKHQAVKTYGGVEI